MLFSERMGITSPKSMIQLDSMDGALKNSLWNNLCLFYFDKIRAGFSIGQMVDMDRTSGQYAEEIAIARFVKSLWLNFFKKPFDITREKRWSAVRDGIRSYFFNAEWYDVYNFLEYFVNSYEKNHDPTRNDNFVKACNTILKQELSAYRFVGYKLAQITSEDEIASIEKALEDTSQLKGINIHLKTALDLLADRKTPDYRNSIKESISAVEAICGMIAGKPHSSLGDTLKEIERKSRIQIHTALKKSFDSLYGYASNAHGIRHALLDEPNLDSEDAKFMLVSCSAFINYLITKTSKAGISL